MNFYTVLCELNITQHKYCLEVDKEKLKLSSSNTKAQLV